MSSTRRAEPGKPLRQERWSSSPEFERGILAQRTAPRCALLESAEERRLIWFVQRMSHALGLKRLVADVKEKFGARIGTATMRKLVGVKKYNAEHVRAVRSELPVEEREIFLLNGEWTLWDTLSSEEQYHPSPEIAEVVNLAIKEDLIRRCRRADGEQLDDVAGPESYPASDFLGVCQRHADRELESDLIAFCNDPRADVKGPWYFAELSECIKELQAEQIAQSRKGKVVTEVGKMIDEVLNYTLATKCLSLTNGRSRIGKTVAIKAWCDAHPHAARYVEVPSTNDDIGFFRAIAKSLGVSCGHNWKAAEMRQRIEDVLQSGDLVVVFDEAHYLWPNRDYRSEPSRIKWIMTALANHGVPVALITTPQFHLSQQATEDSTHWTSEQFIGRIGRYVRLPDSLSEADLFKVAEWQMPEGDDKSIRALVDYANGSAKYLAGIESVVKYARYLAQTDGRKATSRADVRRAIQDGVIPSDRALAAALGDAKNETSRRGKRSNKAIVNEPLMDDLTPVSGPLESNRISQLSEPGGHRLTGQAVGV
jgi:hypothetical protein